MKTLYSTQVTAIGTSSGHLSSDDKLIDLAMKPPLELGGPGGATNPEQLFAAAFAACLSSTMSVAAANSEILLTSPPQVKASVELSLTNSEEYGMRITLEVSLFNQPREIAEKLLTEARRVWPWADLKGGRTTLEIKLSDARH